MMAARPSQSWIDGLPPLRGRIQTNAALAPTSWFRVGGAAALLVRPADSDDLSTLLAALPESEPVTVLGAASNVILRDGGLPGVTIRLGRGFADIAVQADGVIVGAAALDATVAEHAAAAGLGGLEFLCGIPGSIGGAVAMNAGAYGGDMAQVLDWADIVTRDGQALRLTGPELAFSYRHAALPPGGVVVRARLRGRPTAPALVATRMADIRGNRATTQPIRARTGGSTFRNPDAATSSFRAWELIDQAGGRGLARGGAVVSDQHCNFLINSGTATAADIEGLGEELRRRVHDMSGISLRWEIRRLGLPLVRPALIA